MDPMPKKSKRSRRIEDACFIQVFYYRCFYRIVETFTVYKRVIWIYKLKICLSNWCLKLKLICLCLVGFAWSMFTPKVFPKNQENYKIPRYKKLCKLTRRKKESIGELFVASVGGAALAVSWRNAEVRPHTAGQVLRDTWHLCLHWGAWRQHENVLSAFTDERKLGHTVDRLHRRPCIQ